MATAMAEEWQWRWQTSNTQKGALTTTVRAPF